MRYMVYRRACWFSYILAEPRLRRRSERPWPERFIHFLAALHLAGLGQVAQVLNELVFPYTVFFSVSCFEKSVLAILIFSHESSKWSSKVKAASS